MPVAPSRSRYYADTGPTAGWRDRVKARLLARARVNVPKTGENQFEVIDPDFDDFLERYGQ